MKRSDTIANLAAALSAAQGEFEAVPKSAENPFFKSHYADLPSVVQAASPVLAKHGLSVSQLPDFDGEHDMLTTTIMHSSGEWIEASARLHLVKDDPQAQGSATTYMRRYAYSGGLGVVTEEDDDGNAASRPRTAPAARTASPRPAVNGPACPDCGSALRERTGAKGPFVGCSSYPACKFTTNGTLAQFSGEADVAPEEIPSPAANGSLTARIAELCKVVVKDDIRDAFGSVEGGSACLAAMANGQWKIRGEALKALSDEAKGQIIAKLQEAEVPF